MIDGPLSVPVRAHEASQLADLIFQFAEGRTVNDALRRMLAAVSDADRISRANDDVIDVPDDLSSLPPARKDGDPDTK